MHEEIVIKKEELDIDDTTIKLELTENEGQLELPSVRSFMKIIEERSDMITVPVHDCKSEDELKFIKSLSTFDQQQKLCVTSDSENGTAVSLGAFACKICSFTCENHLALASHQINHQLNRHFCCHGCGAWCNTLEEILEHEYREHAGGLSTLSCRICQLQCSDGVALDRHMGSHFYVRRFVCAICRRHFETHQGLQLHWQHSKELCGQVEYSDMHGNLGQMVAVGKLDATVPPELLCDVQIKSEPIDPDEQQPEQLSELTDIVIKTEPEPEAKPDDLASNFIDNWTSLGSSSLAGQLRGKLRLPAKKKFTKDEPLPPINASIQIVPASRLKPIPKPNPVVTIKLPNILKPNKGSNSQPVTTALKKNILQSSKNQPNIAANVLKVLPSNCMLIKLPPNTKIVKIAPNAMTGSNISSVSTPNKIVTLPSALSISPVPVATVKPAASAAPAVPSSSVTTPPVQAAIQKQLVNRNAYFNALSIFENLPESRKIITEFQNQIRSIEQTLPLPGSVLQTPKKSHKAVMPSQLEVIKMPLNKVSNKAVCQMRYTYPNYRFHWECPRCARCYEQYLAFCNHLEQSHGISKEQFEHMEVEVKTYKKLDSSPVPETSSTEKSPEIEESETASVVPAPLATQTATTASTVAVADDVAIAPKPDPAVPASTTPIAPTTSTTAATTTTITRANRTATVARSAQYQCEDCSKCFTTVGALRIHKMIHTGELPHKCNYCDKRFRTPGQVRVHQRRHTGEKPFKCKVCSLDFTHRETLISHLSRHIGMKRYKCYGCDKNFVVVSGLRAHRRLRPDTCGKVKFTARAHGPRVRVIRGEVVFESHPEHNGYLRSEDPLNIMSEINQASKDSSSVASESS